MSDTPNSDVQSSPTTEITLTDLKNVLVLIDLCTQRGAFRGPELSSVAALYDKINTFVSSADASKNTNPTGV
jgi:hypothetical protein